MTERVRWGILGCAGIADWGLLPGLKLSSLATLSAVASRSLPKAQAFAAKHGAPKAYGSYEELLADPEIEVVYVPLPNGLHAEWSIKAMRAGKDVLCEKPIAMDAAEARQIQAVRQETGRLCLEAFAYRFNPVVARTIAIARSGVLGELRFITTCTSFLMAQPDPANVRLRAEIGGGALYDVGCYAINAQRMLAGREPLTAWATMKWSERFDVDMSGTAMLDFGEGLKGTLGWGFETGYSSPPSVSGSKGSLVAPFGWRAPQGKPALVLTVGGEMTEITIPAANDYMGEVQDLSEAVRGLHAPAYVAEPLESNMRVLDACYRSYRSGKPEAV
jgi:D-xylose 1-dehydrogenase (NADP+, D-xylono-1,5-lactone-forming)